MRDSQKCERPAKKMRFSKAAPTPVITEKPRDITIVIRIPRGFDLEKLIPIFSQYGYIEWSYFYDANLPEADKYKRLVRLKFRNEEGAWKAWDAFREKLIKYNDNGLMFTPASDDYSPIQNLPDTCLREIFDRVHVKDRLNLEMVCKRWRENARCCYKSITEIAVVYDVALDWRIDTWRAILSRVGDSLKTVRFYLVDRDDDQYKFIEAVAEHCTHLKKMQCQIDFIDYQFYASRFCTILQNNSNLRQVQFHFDNAWSFDLNFMNAFPAKIEEIDLRISDKNFCTPPVALSRFEKLRTLALHGFKITDDNVVDGVVNLERLSLTNCEISENTFSKILRNSRGLKHLHLAWNGLNQTWFKYVQRLPELQVLVVADEKLADAYLSNMSRLRSLYCIRCKLVTDEGIQNLLNPAANMKKLCVWGCSITLTSLGIARKWTERTGRFLQLFPGGPIYRKYSNGIQEGSVLMNETGNLKVINWDDEELGLAKEKWGLKFLE